MAAAIVELVDMLVDVGATVTVLKTVLVTVVVAFLWCRLTSTIPSDPAAIVPEMKAIKGTRVVNNIVL